jgi:hypothetical protein
MAAALAADPGLRAAAARAVAVRRALRSSVPTPLPAGLRWRLLAMPRGSRPAWRAIAPLAAVSVAAAVVAAVWLRPEPPTVEDPRAVAAQEFELAMRYLQKSARITQSEVTDAVGFGLRDAVATSRAALVQQTEKTGD